MKKLIEAILLIGICSCTHAPVKHSRGLSSVVPTDCGSALSQKPVYIVSKVKDLKGSTGPELVLMSDGTKAVYKKMSSSGGKDVMSANEVTAYRLSLVLGYNNVPLTTYADKQIKHGSLQSYLAIESGAVSKEKKKLYKMEVFDFVISNDDRHFENYLINSDGGLIYIDHGDSFYSGFGPTFKDHVRRKIKKSVETHGFGALPSEIFTATEKEIKEAISDLSLEAQEEVLERIQFLRELRQG